MILEEQLVQALEDVKRDLRNREKRQRLAVLLARTEPPEEDWKIRIRIENEALQELSHQVREDLFHTLMGYMHDVADPHGDIHLPHLKKKLFDSQDDLLLEHFRALYRDLKIRGWVRQQGAYTAHLTYPPDPMQMPWG